MRRRRFYWMFVLLCLGGKDEINFSGMLEWVCCIMGRLFFGFMLDSSLILFII